MKVIASRRRDEIKAQRRSLAAFAAQPRSSGFLHVPPFPAASFPIFAPTRRGVDSTRDTKVRFPAVARLYKWFVSPAYAKRYRTQDRMPQRRLPCPAATDETSLRWSVNEPLWIPP